MLQLITAAYRKSIPILMRKRIADLRLKMRMTPIRVDACLQGGDNGVRAASFARMVGDILRASRPISEWPHVTLLRQYREIGEWIWDRNVFEETDYYRNGALNIEIFGRYLDAIIPEQILQVAQRFVDAYRSEETDCFVNAPRDARNRYKCVTVHPIRNSSRFQVYTGHHRLAIAHMKRIEEIPALILQPQVTTPLQDMLDDVLWPAGSREIYQPVAAPELDRLVLLRRCSDRMTKIIEFLRSENLLPPVCGSYLDVACNLGWFVSEMTKIGFHAEGLDSDPAALSVGRVVYGLKQERLHRASAVTFLRGLRDGYDVTSCFSLAHHFILNRLSVSAEEFLHLLDAATRRVMFFDMGQGHEDFEEWGEKLKGWDAERIRRWLGGNTSFSRIVELGPDEDAVPPNENRYGRTLFACVR